MAVYVLRQTYVDDILGGADSAEELFQLQDELTKLLGSAGFKLHKWNSNERSVISLQVENSKVLGISWNPIADSFQVSVPDIVSGKVFTKREVLGIIAQIFDPIGFIGPVIIRAKIFMQQLWSVKIGWDEVVPPDLLNDWLKFYEELPRLRDFVIPRWIFINEKVVSIQLIGFSDASQVAYGACLYVRAVYENSNVTTHLVVSKSRVAPLKTVSLPRLELCGFLLLMRMCERFKSCVDLKFDRIIMFTDSKIVPAWLQSPPSRWATFVANRVSEIQDLSANVEWKHVPSEINTADYISRGLDPVLLLNCKVCLEGPQFLADPNWNITENVNLDFDDIPEQRQISHVQTRNEIDGTMFMRFSTFARLQRSLGFVLRFINNSKKDCQKLFGPLSVEEIDQSSFYIFKVVQAEHFSQEISNLKEGRSLFKGSALLGLNPSLDPQGLLRVGGRLENAPISFDARHPVILPKCHVTDLMIEHEHRLLGHAGPRAVLSSLRQRVWIVNALRRIKSILVKCVKCHRFKAAVSKQIMGDLPSERITLVRAFYNVGIDFGGPIMVKESKLRKARVSKAYIALFICMATKTIHIELVSSLSTEDFILALKRFVARRGNPASIISDNATNFKGAQHALHDVFRLFQNHLNEIQDFLSTSHIHWRFIPPNSPHWGGLWEAGIKSTKYHLRRVVGSSILSFECLYTVLVQIEAILNSRPLQAASDSIEDLTCLTPGHFLIGQPMTAFAERDASGISENRLSLWQHCAKIRQDFWRLWSRDYLNQLQHRPKWKCAEGNLCVGDMVLVREDNLPPLEWCLARVVEVMPGRDNRVRVVKVKTVRGEFTRPTAKLSPLSFKAQIS